jgi:predicted dehydrogenase
VIRVCIVGCGNIAGGFDLGKAADALPLTHAGAFRRDGGFAVTMCVDPDESRRLAFQEAWEIPASVDSLESISGLRGQFDVISICSPTALHAEHVRAAVALTPRLIFCEKPVTPSADETAACVALCEGAGILLAVNHTRRWAPDVVRLRDQLRAGQWGKVRSISGQYTKGIINNGSHLVDLLLMLFGAVTVRSAGRAVADFWPDDPTIPAMLELADGTVAQISAGDARDYALFELQIVTERGVIAMEGGGLSWRIRRAAESQHFAGYRALDAGEIVAGEYFSAMTAAAANIRRALENNEPLASTGATALGAQRVCEQIRILSNG